MMKQAEPTNLQSPEEHVLGNFLTFLLQEYPQPISMIVIHTGLAGLTGGGVIALFLYTVSNIKAGMYPWGSVSLLFVMMLVYAGCRYFSQTLASRLGEQIFEVLVVRICGKLRQSEFVELERTQTSDVYSKLLNAQRIADLSLASVEVGQQSIVVVICGLFLLNFSIAAALLVVIYVLFNVLMYEAFQQVQQENIKAEHQAQQNVFNVFRHLLYGFKEIKLDRWKSNDLFEGYLTPYIYTLQEMHGKVTSFYMAHSRLVRFGWRLFLGACVFFVLPQGFPGEALVVMSIFTYLGSRTQILLVRVPELLNGKAAIEEVWALQQHVEIQETLSSPDTEEFTTFEQCTLQNITFSYPTEDGFTVGPVNMTINAGELLVIAGGNGSGKSTLMKLLCGLYAPSSGTYEINGQQVPMDEHGYLFSSVFSDAHLFDALYGIDRVDEQKVAELLERFELAHTTRLLEGQRFSHQDLSAGQKKRLALIVALLEDKPVYLFDEWAADQDPHFRRYFYETLLPELKDQGKTVILVSHDDQFFHVADRIFLMERGQLRETDDVHLFGQHLHTVSSEMAADEDAARSKSARSDGDIGRHWKPQTPRTVAEFRGWEKTLEPLKGSAWTLFILSLLYAVCNIGFIKITHIVVELPAGTPTELYFIVFLLTFLLLYVVTNRFDFKVLKLLEDYLANLRLILINHVRHTDLRTYQQFGADKLYTALTFDIEAISKMGYTISNLARVIVLILGVFVFIGSLSYIGGIVVVTALTGNALLLILLRMTLSELLQHSRQQEQALFGAIRHLLEGCKELCLNLKKNDDFFQNGVKVFAARLRQEKNKVHAYEVLMDELGHTFKLAILLLLLVLVPLFDTTDRTVLLKISTIILFMPIDGYIMYQIMRLTLANISVQRFYEFGEQLKGSQQEDLKPASHFASQRVERLAYQDIRFHYETHDERPFSIGPARCEFSPGEVVFITGGNGSGKSTLLLLLCGLYQPDSGSIVFNDDEIDLRQYREMFTVIFSDVYLFDRLYGHEEVDEERLASLLKVMQLEQKVECVDGAFSTLDLSTGQKKRLAMVIALLEDKPVYIFDEWAAGLDPEFRVYFYRTLLPSLKQQGKMVIAITHDARYFDAADRVLNMQDGQLAEQSRVKNM